MMNPEQAAILLEKFYEGTSTLSEERRLLDYLRAADCPPSLQADRNVIEELADLPETQMPAALQTRIISHLTSQTKLRRRCLWKKLATVTGIAASVAVICFGLYFTEHRHATVYADTCGTPQQAACETRNVLLYVSEQLNTCAVTEDDLGGPLP